MHGFTLFLLVLILVILMGFDAVVNIKEYLDAMDSLTS